MAGAVQHMKKFMEEVGETTRQLEQVLAEIRGPQQHEGEHGEDGEERHEGLEEEVEVGTAETARRRVRIYFQALRDQLCVQVGETDGAEVYRMIE